MLDLYHQVCKDCSQIITNKYSTSFSLGIKLFAKELRDPIYAVYGFVRFADEIVDTFHNYNKRKLLDEFKVETHKAIEDGISLNPVLHSFQQVVREYAIDIELIDAFLKSMKMDLGPVDYDINLYKEYIYGSAEVVGLMCLKIFTNKDDVAYQKLKPSAMSLGSAFQKINFLRDIKDDFENKGRTYFPDVEMNTFSDKDKRLIEADINIDFKEGLLGITKLPKSARFGVYIAYIFYFSLFQKIRGTTFQSILQGRVRINNRKKAYLLAKYSIKNSLNLI